MIDISISSADDLPSLKYAKLTQLMKACASGEYVGDILTSENINESNDNVSAFMCACYGGNIKNIRAFLKFPELNLYQEDEWWHNALSFACINGNSENVRTLLEFGNWNLRQCSCYGLTLLMQACMSGYENIVDLILEKDPTIADLQDSRGNIALMYANAGGNLEIVKKLLRKNTFDLKKYCNNYNETLFMAACMGGNYEIAKIFSEYEDVSVCNEIAQTTLMFAAAGGNIKIIKLILEKYPDELNRKDEDNATALIYACKNNKKEAVKYLLSLPNIEINTLSDEGTALHLSCWEDSLPEIFDMLINHSKIDVNIADEYGNTPLMIACRNGCFSAARKLLEKPGIHGVNLRNKNGDTTFILSCGNWDEDNSEFIDYLLANFEIDINDVNQWGNSALSAACACGNVNIVKTLLQQKDIDVNISGNLLLPTCWGSDRHEKRAEIFKILLDLPDTQFDVNEGDADAHTETPLMYACRENHTEIIKMLLQHPQIDINKLEEGYDNSAFTFACYNREQSLAPIKLMLSYGETHKDTVDFSNRIPLDLVRTKEIFQYLLEEKKIYSANDIPTWYLMDTINQDAGVWLIEKYGDSIDFNSGRYLSPLQMACHEGYQQIVRTILQRKDVDVNYVSDEKNIAILEATWHNCSIPCAKLLLERPELNLNCCDENGCNPLMLACKWGSLDVAKVIIQRNVLDINSKDNRGDTALIHACRSFNSDLVKYLLDIPNIDINATNNKGKNAIVVAAKMNNISIVGELLKHRDKINLDAKTISGKTALDYAKQKKYQIIANMLQLLVVSS